MALRIVVFFLLGGIQGIAFAQNIATEIDRAAFYAAFSSEDAVSIDEQLSTITPENALSKAFSGALLMKKAGIIKGPKEKLDTFKAGKELLDSAITSEPQNAEFRFLRLVIQEQAPAILNYNDKKKEDAALVVNTYSDFPEVVKNFVRSYAQTSSTLSAHDFE